MILRRMPALDGLRGVAVLLVVAEHTFDRPLAHAGRFGVAVFFVLSGYLITSLLLAEHTSTGRLDLRAFWVRRAVRLGPAFGVLLVVLPLLMALAGDPDLPLYPLMALIAGTYTTDLFAAYLDVDLRGLAHTWSLAVEEQFYLLWPLLLLALLRLARGRPDALRSGVWALVGVLAVVRGVLTWRADPLHVYYAPETSAFALAVGCGLAVDPRARAVLARAGRPALAALLAVALLTGTVSGSPDMRVTNGVMPLVVVLAACVVPLAGASGAAGLRAATAGGRAPAGRCICRRGYPLCQAGVGTDAALTSCWLPARSMRRSGGRTAVRIRSGQESDP